MLQHGIRAMFSLLSLDGPDKWSLDPRFLEEIVSGGLISDLRMFLSDKGLLGRVTKLKRSSDRIKLQPVWYLTIEKENSMLGVLDP
jgi:hypothetical protein